MKVYITYDRYEHDEFFQIYGIDTERNVAVNLYMSTYLPDFVLSDPDDCHQFQLVAVEITEEMYEKLVSWTKIEDLCDTTSNKEFYQFMCDLHNSDTTTVIVNSYNW